MPLSVIAMIYVIPYKHRIPTGQTYSSPRERPTGQTYSSPRERPTGHSDLHSRFSLHPLLMRLAR